MHHNEQLLHDFYQAFAEGDAQTMARSYHDEAFFSDPVFPDLDANGVRSMWKMLCERGKDLKIEYAQVTANDFHGSAHWEAWYTFEATGRKVHNVIEATFSFRDGKILRHQDDFEFWRWSRQALGPAGVLLGWTPILQGRVQKMAGTQLARYRIRNT